MPLQEARDVLARYLFRGDMIDQTVGTLSGGERSRLALAKLSADDINILLLDEPTNHLDITAREALEAVLDAYTGTILFVTHDRALISNLATQTWLVTDGRVAVLDGGVIELPEQPASAERMQAAAKPERRENVSPAREAARRARELEKLEAEIEDFEARLKALGEELERASSSLDVQATAEIGSAYTAAERQLQDLMAAWETAAQAVEVAAGA
jgi:ATP-binding cassette subfamily F protein 3